MASAALMNSRRAALCFMSPKQRFSIAFKLLIVAFSTNIKPAHHLRGRRFFRLYQKYKKFGLHAPAIPGVK
jgi:hypothetical protein